MDQLDELEPISVEDLLAQGFCCGNECQNCPYLDEEGNRFQVGSTKINERLVKASDKTVTVAPK